MVRKIGILVLFICSFIILSAQSDKKAKALLDEVSAKYDAYQTIQSTFSFSVRQQQENAHVDNGVLYLNKPKSQFRIELPQQHIIGDGKNTWSILKGDKEVQVSESANDSKNIGPNNLFTFYKKGFVAKIMKDEVLGRNVLRAVELTPIDPTTNYTKIKIRLNKNSHIHDVNISDKSGTQYTYTIHKLYVNHQIPETKFSFNTSDYPGYELVDLR